MKSKMGKPKETDELYEVISELHDKIKNYRHKLLNLTVKLDKMENEINTWRDDHREIGLAIVSEIKNILKEE